MTLNSILLMENHGTAGLAALHNHGGTFHHKSDCWSQTYVTTFGGGVHFTASAPRAKDPSYATASLRPPLTTL